MKDINEENHWRSLWQKRRRRQMKAGPPKFEVVVVVAAGLKGWREESVSPVWLYWNLEPLAAQARQDMKLLSTSKAWLLTRFSSKERQTFISCTCLLSSAWLWSALPCSGSPSPVPWLNRNFCKRQSHVISYIYKTSPPSEILLFPALRELSAKTLPLPQLAERSQHCTQRMGLVPKRRITHWLQRPRLSSLFPRTAELEILVPFMNVCVGGRKGSAVGARGTSKKHHTFQM